MKCFSKSNLNDYAQIINYLTILANQNAIKVGGSSVLVESKNSETHQKVGPHHSSSMLLLQPQVSVGGFSECPTFLDSLSEFEEGNSEEYYSSYLPPSSFLMEDSSHSSPSPTNDSSSLFLIHSSSSPPTPLPSFQDTYSPRYSRSNPFSFEDLAPPLYENTPPPPPQNLSSSSFSIASSPPHSSFPIGSPPQNSSFPIGSSPTHSSFIGSSPPHNSSSFPIGSSPTHSSFPIGSPPPSSFCIGSPTHQPSSSSFSIDRHSPNSSSFSTSSAQNTPLFTMGSASNTTFTTIQNKAVTIGSTPKSSFSIGSTPFLIGSSTSNAQNPSNSIGSSKKSTFSSRSALRSSFSFDSAQSPPLAISPAQLSINSGGSSQGGAIIESSSLAPPLPIGSLFSQSEATLFYTPPPEGSLKRKASLCDSECSLTSNLSVGSEDKEESSSSVSPSAKLCAVCGDTAACQHYGVVTCEGCKGFFKRTVQRGAKYVCMASRNCPVDKRRRNRCQFCRFQKCLTVGMVREVVRTDSLKGRRGRLPSKAKEGGSMGPSAPPSPPISLITSLVRAHLDSTPPHHTQQLYSYEESDFSERSESIVQHPNPEHIENFFRLLTSCFEVIRNFGTKIPGFSSLSHNDQETLLQSGSLELFILRLAYSIDGNESRLVFCDGTVMSREELRPVLGEWFESILEFSSSLHNIQLDLSGMACLESLTLITDRSNLEDGSRVEELQMRIISCLRDHVTYSVDSTQKPHYFSRILGKLPELRSLSVQGLQRIFYLKLEDSLPVPPVIESMFSSTLPF